MNAKNDIYNLMLEIADGDFWGDCEFFNINKSARIIDFCTIKRKRGKRIFQNRAFVVRDLLEKLIIQKNFADYIYMEDKYEFKNCINLPGGAGLARCSLDINVSSLWHDEYCLFGMDGMAGDDGFQLLADTIKENEGFWWRDDRDKYFSHLNINFLFSVYHDHDVGTLMYCRDISEHAKRLVAAAR
jgi:hypothetical protein